MLAAAPLHREMSEAPLRLPSKHRQLLPVLHSRKVLGVLEMKQEPERVRDLRKCQWGHCAYESQFHTQARLGFRRPMRPSSCRPPARLRPIERPLAQGAKEPPGAAATAGPSSQLRRRSLQLSTAAPAKQTPALQVQTEAHSPEAPCVPPPGTPPRRPRPVGSPAKLRRALEENRTSEGDNQARAEAGAGAEASAALEAVAALEAEAAKRLASETVEKLLAAAACKAMAVVAVKGVAGRILARHLAVDVVAAASERVSARLRAAAP
mmetsp:Transcript_155214/g.376986  ORF Transcript_155214/g.376986 Transcript_155214/m.376986 type:complete len:266 (+) Transcript_155214:62-859(+)